MVLSDLLLYWRQTVLYYSRKQSVLLDLAIYVFIWCWIIKKNTWFCQICSYIGCKQCCIIKENNWFCQIWPYMCSNGVGLLRKIHSFIRFALILDANSAVLLKKTIGFVRFGHICVQMVLDY